MKGLIFDIKRFAIHDGPGIRTTVFFQGCPLHCKWCHNPESICKNPKARCHSVEEIFDEIDKDIMFYEESNGGVTFSGGEPLLQPEFLYELSMKCKENGIHTTLDTCGFAEKSIFQNAIENIDLILYDLKILDEKKHFFYTGKSNETILQNLRSLSNQNKEFIIRFPLIPMINNDDENLCKIVEIMNENNIKKIHILPYHHFASHKYEKLSKDFVNFEQPTKKEIQRVENYFQEHNFIVQIGG